MPKINFQELLQEAIKAKGELHNSPPSKEKNILDVAIVALSCGYVISTIAESCFKSSSDSVTAGKQ